MIRGMCGIDCGECPMNESCLGCEKTCGRPFGGKCVLAECVIERGIEKIDGLQKEFIDIIHQSGIRELEEVKELFALRGAFVNLEFDFPQGKVKVLDDNQIYLGCQVPSGDTRYCYGVAINKEIIMVAKYGENGTNPELLLYKKISN